MNNATYLCPGCHPSSNAIRTSVCAYYLAHDPRYVQKLISEKRLVYLIHAWVISQQTSRRHRFRYCHAWNVWSRCHDSCLSHLTIWRVSVYQIFLARWHSWLRLIKNAFEGFVKTCYLHPDFGIVTSSGKHAGISRIPRNRTAA